MAVTVPSPTFDRQDPGTPEERWHAADLTRHAALLQIDDVRHLVILAAHPDDETLGAGGLIRRLHARGADVDVVAATDGEASHPRSPTHPADRIADLRRIEISCAIDHLAPGTRVRRLGLPDGRLAAHHDDLVAAAHAAVGADPRNVLLVAPWRVDRHPDHAAVARAAQQVARTDGVRLVEYPLWAWHWADPGDPRLHPSRLAVLDLGETERVAKHAAIGMHRSQIAPLGPAPADRPVLSSGFLEHFRRPYEVFVPFRRSLEVEYFDALYRDSADPWRLADHWYEQRKRALTVAALPRPRFRSAFEPGCAAGLLTDLLAGRCDRLLAADGCAAAVDLARRGTAGHRHVTVEQLAVPREWPERRTFDLVVLSEIGYYLDHVDLSRLIAATLGALDVDGVLLACHWRHPAPGHPLTGDEVHDAIVAESGLRTAASHLEEDFRLDVLTRPGGESVARWEGMLT